MIKNKLKSSRAISLLSLSITVILILILTDIIIYNLKDNLEVKSLQELQNDIENIKDKVDNYYEQNGSIPAKIKYNNITAIKNAGLISEAVDTGDFLVIDLQALDNLTLNYGNDYEKIKSYSGDVGSTVEQYTDLYIINESSHNIFYVEGIACDGSIYYTNYTSADVDKKAINLRYVDNVKIPEGFYYVGGTKDDGIVISDVQGDDMNNSKHGNQFVWVPVPDIDQFKRVNGYSDEKLVSVIESCGEADATGKNTNTGITEADETQQEAIDMYDSVKKYEGFYIGRYEAGNDGKNNVIVQQGAAVYSNIKWGTDMTDGSGGAVQKAREFIQDKSYKNNVTSTLVYGVQWDAVMQFMDNKYLEEKCETTNSYVANSEGKGWYTTNYQTENLNHKTGIDLADGANKVKNIYDMAGNVYEWTMEAYGSSERIFRGGYYLQTGTSAPASYRSNNSPSYSESFVGFRVALYLNTEEKWSPKYDENGVYKDKNEATAIIPKGFQVSQTLGENTIADGLVVKDSNENEFVWVPVPNIETIANKISGKDDYQGKLYDFITPEGNRASTSTEKVNYGQETLSYREPAYLSGENYDDNQILFTKYSIQEDYNSMIESIIKYKGFYVSRYEISLTGGTTSSIGEGTAQSKPNVKSATANWGETSKWYGLYSKIKTYDGGTSVVGGMIWGSQYDAIMNWIQADKVDVTSTTPKGASYNTEQITGKSEKDKINNIYDLLGCNYEWTLEANGADTRVLRSGNYNNNVSLTNRSEESDGKPTSTYDNASSRIVLYIK